MQTRERAKTIHEQNHEDRDGWTTPYLAIHIGRDKYSPWIPIHLGSSLQALSKLHAVTDTCQLHPIVDAHPCSSRKYKVERTQVYWPCTLYIGWSHEWGKTYNWRCDICGKCRHLIMFLVTGTSDDQLKGKDFPAHQKEAHDNSS